MPNLVHAKPCVFIYYVFIIYDIFTTKIRVVLHGTLTTGAFSCRCNNGKVPTNILVINAITFRACGVDWMNTR